MRSLLPRDCRDWRAAASFAVRPGDAGCPSPLDCGLRRGSPALAAGAPTPETRNRSGPASGSVWPAARLIGRCDSSIGFSEPIDQTRSKSVRRSPHCSDVEPSGSKKSRFLLDRSQRPGKTDPEPTAQPLPGRHRGRGRGAEPLFGNDLAANHIGHALPVLERLASRSPGTQRTRRFPSEVGSARIPWSKTKVRQSGRFIRVAFA